MTSKLKPALFYALRPAQGSYEIIAVTTAKPNGQWFGRVIPYNSPTNGSNRSYHAGRLIGRFNTQAAARAIKNRADAIKARHAPMIRLADAASSAARKAERDELTALAADV